MFDLITLSCLYLFTAGTSIVLHLLGLWPSGMWWFWFWNTVTASVLTFEAVSYLKDKTTMTRRITKSGDQPYAARNKWIGRLIVASFGAGAFSLCLHLWPWK